MKILKRKISMLLSVILILSAVPVFANTAEELVVADASKWAKSEIVEAERYGLYDKEIYKDSLKNKLQKDTMVNLLKNIESKLSNSELNKNTEVKSIEVGDNTTRGGFLRELYNRLTVYEKEDNLSKDPIMYLNHIGVVKGNGKQNLYLDRKITTEEAIIFAKRAVSSIYNENDLATKNLMWEIENKNNKVYLLGSIHVGDPSLYPFTDEVMKRYNESDELYVEVDISDVEAVAKSVAELNEKELIDMKYSDGKTLESVVGKELYKDIKEYMDKYEIPEELYKNMKPYGVEVQIQSIYAMEYVSMIEKDPNEFDYSSLGSDYGIDIFFLEKAKTDGKAVHALEDLMMQLELLSVSPNKKLDEKGQLEKLIETMEYIKNPEGKKTPTTIQDKLDLMVMDGDSINTMLTSIKKGKPEELAKIFTEVDGEQSMDGKLLGDRDVAMAKGISELLESDEGKTYFVVIGAAHYVTEGMTLDNLKDMGYNIKSLND